MSGEPWCEVSFEVPINFKLIPFLLVFRSVFVTFELLFALFLNFE